MGKSKLDLDFSDVTGGKPKKKKTPETPVEEKKEPKDKLSEINLMVIQGEDWVEKDLALCTDDEYLSWVFSVLPPDFPLEKKEVKGLEGKIKIFKLIVNMGKTPLFISRNSGKLAR